MEKAIGITLVLLSAGCWLGGVVSLCAAFVDRKREVRTPYWWGRPTPALFWLFGLAVVLFCTGWAVLKRSTQA